MPMLFALFISLLFFFEVDGTPLKVNVTADAVLLLNADTGVVLYEKNGYDSYYPASITKIATALYTLQKKGSSLHEIATAQQDAIGSITEEQKLKANYKPPYRMVVGGSHIGLKRDERMSLKDLLYGLMLASGDDAANVIAQHVSGTVPQFMDEVNSYLQDLGLKNTYLLNPHGLHHPNHKTTAYDMAILTQEALKNPTFKEIVSTVRYTRPKTNKQEPTTWVNTNRLLRSGPSHYPKAFGVKTGLGSPSLSTLVAAAEQNGRTLIAVILHCPDKTERFKDAIALFEAAFQENQIERTLLKAGPQTYSPPVKNAPKPIQTYIEKNVTLQYYPSEEPQVKALLAWDNLSLPIAKGQRVGEIRLSYADGSVFQTVPLLSSEEVKLSWWQKFTN